MANILITHGVPIQPLREKLPEHTLMIPEAGAAFSRKELLDNLPQADFVLACGTMDREMIVAATRLRLIVCYGAGYDSIDVKAATERSIPVVNVPEPVAAATAEHTIALMTGIARRICELDRLMRTEPVEDCFGLGKRMGTSLAGGTLGVVGMGRIGSRVAEFGRLMNMRVLYVSRTQKHEQEAWGARRVPLKELMETADFVSLHCPHTNETEGLISRTLLMSMQPTAFLINTARGRVVDEEALADVLEQNRIAGAALDVFCNEPHVNPRLLALPNVLMTPHCAANNPYTRAQMALAVAKRIQEALDGRMLQDLVNSKGLGIN